MREKLNVPLSPGERAALEPRLRRAVQMLGPEEAAEVWVDGCAMPIDDVIDEALQPPPATPAVRNGARLKVNEPLTRRESDVAKLVANGLSNRDIARELVITERTVENHVSHIFDALGVTSRTQLATWVIEKRHSTSSSN
jgi:non-specific serine/threonine protein kinase